MNETIDNFTSSHPPQHYLDEKSLFLRLGVEIYTIVVILNTICSLVQMFVIWKHKVLRNDLSYKNLVFINITQIIFMLLTSTRLRIFMDLYNHVSISSRIQCAFENFITVCGFFYLTLLNISVIIWVIKNYFPSNKNPKKFSIIIYKISILITLIVSLILLGYAFDKCMRNFTHAWNFFFVFISCVVLVLQLVVVNTYRVVRAVFFKEGIKIIGQIDPGLAVANIFLITWLPSCLFIAIGILWKTSNYFYVVGIAFVLSGPIWTLLYLFLFNGKFNAFLKSLARCRWVDEERNFDEFLVLYCGNENLANQVQVRRSSE